MTAYVCVHIRGKILRHALAPRSVRPGPKYFQNSAGVFAWLIFLSLSHSLSPSDSTRLLAVLRVSYIGTNFHGTTRRAGSFVDWIMPAIHQLLLARVAQSFKTALVGERERRRRRWRSYDAVLGSCGKSFWKWSCFLLLEWDRECLEDTCWWTKIRFALYNRCVLDSGSSKISVHFRILSERWKIFWVTNYLANVRSNCQLDDKSIKAKSHLTLWKLLL